MLRDIKIEAAQLSASLESGKSYIFYSGLYDAAEIVAGSNSGAGWIEDTDAANFLKDSSLQGILESAFIDSDQINQKMIYDLNSPWDQVSARYADHASGKVIQW